MRIYTYLSKEELMRVGITGLFPQIPHTEVSKLLSEHIKKYPRNIHIWGKIYVPLSAKAIYGAINLSAANLAAKQAAFPGGSVVFFALNPRKHYPVVVANYKYKSRIFELLMLKDHDPEVENGKFKDYKEGIRLYTAAYWNSVKSLYTFTKYMLSHAEKEYPHNERNYAIRKFGSNYEVLAYIKVSPENLFVPTAYKQYMPFLLWLYKHRGLYLNKVRLAQTPGEKYRYTVLMRMFTKKYNEFKSKVDAEGEKYLKEVYYVRS